uniref:Uncharacterized protein n=1 Tax=Arundo donax TaxID=35708 RepID=A0A0A9C6T0_ARUDO
MEVNLMSSKNCMEQ